MMFYILQQQQIHIFEKIVEKLCKVAVASQLTIIFVALVSMHLILLNEKKRGVIKR